MLSTKSGIDRALIGRWLRAETQPSVESVRTVAHAIGRATWEGLIAAGILSEEELIAAPDSPDEPDLRLVDDDKLVAEVRRRMGRGRGKPPSGGDAYTEIEEQGGVETGETEEVSGGRRSGRPSARAAG